MSRNRGHATSWVPAASGVEEFKDQMLNQLREATMVKPSGRLDLNARLGYPDFEPATAEKDEDKLTDKRLRDGFYDTSAGLYTAGSAQGSNMEEHGSMEEKFGQQDLKEIRARLQLPAKENVKPRRIKHKCSLFPEPEYTGANHLEQWLKDLASCEQPLSVLAKQVPYMANTSSSRGTELLRRLTELQVPLLRAAWFVKVTLLKEKNDRSPPAITAPSDAVDRQVEQKLAENWTEVMTSFMEEHFLSFAQHKGKCDSGSQVEKLVRKWAYLVRFADWCYHEGMLSRSKYMVWVLQAFQGTVKDPQHQASWSAELMLPLIVNLFPDLCRLRTELPDLIRVCVNRYMMECMALHATPSLPLAPPPPLNPKPLDPPQLPLSQPTTTTSTPVPSSQSLLPPTADLGAAAGGAAGGGGVGMAVTSQALLVNLRKTVQSLLVVHPEAFLALHPEVQTAWRLIEQDARVQDMSVLKAALRDEATLVEVPAAWLSSAMPWVDAEHRARAEGPEPANTSWFQIVEALDRCCAGRSAGDPAPLREVLLKKQGGVGAGGQAGQRWQAVFLEHARAPAIASTVFGWAVSRFRGHVPEAIYVAVSLLQSLSSSLTDVFKTPEPVFKTPDPDPASTDPSLGPASEDLASTQPTPTPAVPPSSGAVPSTGGAGGSEAGAEGKGAAVQEEYPLQGFLEKLLNSFEPEEGYAELELERLERLVGELIRQRLFDHNRWVHKLIAKGVFEAAAPGGGEKESQSAVLQQRLLANLASYAEARIDHCQRRILLHHVGLLDLEPSAVFYAHKTLRWLWWDGPNELSAQALACVPGAAALAELEQVPADTKAVGRLDVGRIYELEWEEAVQLAWLVHEKEANSSGAFTDGVLAARAEAVVLRSLVSVFREAPMYVKAQLAHHIATTLKVVVDRNKYEKDLELVEEKEIPAGAGLTEVVVVRAVLLLEASGDLRTLVHTLLWLLEHAPSAACAMALLVHLRTVRAIDMSTHVWTAAMGALLAEATAGRAHSAAAIGELMCGMVRQASENDQKTLEERLLKDKALEGPSCRAAREVEAVKRALEAARKNEPLDAPPAADEAAEVKELGKAGEQRPELADLVEGVLSRGQTCQAAAAAILAKMTELKAGSGALAATILRAAVNGTMQEVRAGYRFGCSGYAISRCVSLVAALQAAAPSTHRLPRLLLQLVMEHAEAALGAAHPGEDTSPSTVDTPQAQTPFSPATPDSVPVHARASDSAEVRQDATLALVGALVARGILQWKEVEEAAKQRLESVVKEKQQGSPARLLLNLVELLLTDKRRGAAGLMAEAEWVRLRVLRQSQATHNAVYLMLKYIVQLAVFVGGPWKQPALACIQQVVHDGGFCRIAMSDDPHAFLKECCRPCMSILRAEPDVVSPFRYFTFVPHDSTKTPPAGPVAAVQEVMSRMGRWSLNYDCRELRILVDAWKREIAELGGSELNSWKALKAGGVVDVGKAEAFEVALRPGEFEAAGQIEQAFVEAFTRAADKLVEHHIVDMLLARLWAAPQDVSHVLYFAKNLGLCFMDKDGMDAGVWFEAQMFKVILAVMAAKPVAKAQYGLHAFFRDFLHPAALVTGDKAEAVEERASVRHRAQFEHAIIHLFASAAIPLPDRPPGAQPDRVEAVKLRHECATKLLALLQAAVDQVQRRDFHAPAPGGDAMEEEEEEGPGRRATLKEVQKAVVLRVECLGAMLAHMWEDGQDMVLLLRRVLDCLHALLSAQTLLADVTGARVYRAATALIDKVGSQRDLPMRGPGQQLRLSQWFRSEAQKVLLSQRLPRMVEAQLSCGLPLRDVWLTSGGFVRRTSETATSELPAQGEGGRRAGLESVFDVDPWLLLEDFSGVLGRHLGSARKRPRKRLALEYASAEQLQHEKQQEEAAAAKQAQELQAQAAAAAAAAAPAVLEDPEMELGTSEVPEAPMSLGGADNGSWGGWTDLGGDGGNFLMDLDL